MDITILEPFTVLDVPSLAFQLFNKTIDQNSRIKTIRSKKIKIHRSSPGVIHFDGDPVMDEKDVVVEIIPSGLNVVIGKMRKEEIPTNVMQQMLDYFNGLSPIEKEVFQKKYKSLFYLNKQLLKRRTKK